MLSTRKMMLLTSFQVLLLCLGFSLVDCTALPRNEVEALTSFKRAIIEDPFLVLSNWNPLETDPCNWIGVYCSIGGDHVVKLNISWSSIKGFIAPELYRLSILQELILHGNLLIGTIPKEIGLLGNLKALDLGANQLVGQIPAEIGNLTGIKKINLQSNGLIGKLPPELGKLRYLQELRLDRNKLYGIIPAANGSAFHSNMQGMYASNTRARGFCGFSELKVVDLSDNFLVGSIPKCLQYLSRSSFRGNCFQDNGSKQRSAAQCGSSPPAQTHSGVNATHKPIQDGSAKHQHQSKDSKPTWLLALKIVTGIMLTLLFLAATITLIQKWKRKPSIILPWKKSASAKDYTTIYINTEAMKDVVEYSRSELVVACEDFSNIIGASEDSLVYKGTIKGGPEIAVISLCLKEEDWTGYLELYFQKEVADLARINHGNAAKLLGYCRESNPFTRMLVFEYASNGTLYEHLHYEEGYQFSWKRRMNIIIGIARGLKYLHTELDPPYTISDLDSNSIYLTEEFSPKLVDFECWKTILSRLGKSSGPISNEGTICVHPNSLKGRQPDVHENIYAFGILLLEIVSGRPPHCNDAGPLVDWAKEFLDALDGISNLVDPELKHFGDEDLKVICEVVKMCICPSSSTRATMQELCSMLEGGIDMSVSADIKVSSLAWAELALSS